MRSRVRSTAIAVLLLLLSGYAGARLAAAQPSLGAGAVPTGVPRILGAQTDSRAGSRGTAPVESRGYSLFLPSSYTTERMWPVLFCFDPGRRSALPIELFRAAAERIGMIIVSADNFSSSGPAERSIEAMTALRNDAVGRYPLDLDRIYATGFSGGGRLCWLLAEGAPEIHLAGIIEVGAGFPWPELPVDFDASHFAFCGLTGETDFNYHEVKRVGGVLRGRGVPSRIVTFEGGHEWPPATECCDALEWLQIAGMRVGAVPADSSLIVGVYDREMAAGAREESEGRLIEARDRFRSITETFAGLRDLSVPMSSLQRLEASAELAALETARHNEAEWASGALDRAVGVLEDAVREPDEPFLHSAESLGREIGLGSLLAKAASANREERLAARRVLAGIHVRVAVYLPRELERRGRPTAAAVMLELAAAIDPEDSEAPH